MIEALALKLFSLGSSGHAESVLGGVIVFGAVGLATIYLSYFNDEFADTMLFKALGVIMFILAAVSFLWPYRPWPTAI